MKNPFASFFRSLLERFRPPPTESVRPALSREQLRELLIDALDDPVIARMVANRLLLPAFPIQGGVTQTVTTSAGTMGYVPVFATVPDIENSAIFQSGSNVGIGTANPQAILHVKGGGITIEDNMGAGRLGFAETGESNARIVLYRGGQACNAMPPGSPDITILRNFPQANASDSCVVWTILKIWAPSGAVANDREATLTLARGDNDEEFMDVYNNGYSPETQYGIRIAKNSGGQFRDFVFDQLDKTQTPNVKTLLMILKTDGKVGIGTDVPGARLEVADPTVLAAESLTNGALTGGTSWTRTLDMALVSNAATYTHSTGSGTLNQASGALAIAGKANRLYLFTYTISGVSGAAASASVTPAFAAVSRPLVTNANGTYTVMLHAAAVPGDFIISVTSAATGSFTIDALSLKEVIGGDIIADGLVTGGGTSGVKVDAAGNVGIGTTAPGTYLPGTGTFLDLIAASGWAFFGLGSSKTANAVVGDINYYNTAIGGAGADKRLVVLRALRDSLDNSGAFELFTRNAGAFVNAVHVSPAGNVGIGDTNPSTLLSVGGKYKVASAGLISAYNNIATVKNGVPAEYGSADATAQGANIAATTLLTPSASGMFRVSVYTIVTRPATTSSTLPSVNVAWTDPDSNVAQSLQVTPTNSGNSTTTLQTGSVKINAKVGVAVSFSTSGYASSGATSMQYSVHIIVEAL